jgi:hypothetical protein
MIHPASKSNASLRGISLIAALLAVAAWPAVAAVSLGPIATNAAQEKMKRELLFHDARASLQQQIDAGKARYELREEKRAEALKAMAAQLAITRQVVAIPPSAISSNNKTESGWSLWILLIIAALGAGFWGARYYRNHRLRQRPLPGG